MDPHDQLYDVEVLEERWEDKKDRWLSYWTKTSEA